MSSGELSGGTAASCRGRAAAPPGNFIQELMKTSKAYFNRFKKAFLYWQEKLGLTNYRVHFELKYLSEEYASIDIDEETQIALVTLTDTIEPGINTRGDVGPEFHGKHEAIHLLTFKLCYLAQKRWINQEQVMNEWEVLVRRLEKVLK
ncbi:MAG: hypothetical protein A2173_03800 [Planctomycetes bacterium RBG_13_44_8b]|nr:MAG: hypothetical protein A2173_03800 [Planctomycetes bacterium RBG_13_44_8b]